MEPTRDVESSRLASDSELALLEASTAKRAVFRQRVKEEFAPQAELPHSANPDKHEMPEYMFYGIGVMHYELVEYAWRKRLFSPEGSIVEPGLVTAMTVAAACLEELEETTRFHKLIIRWPKSPKYDWVIALYSNYHLSPKLEDKIVKRVTLERENGTSIQMTNQTKGRCAQALGLWTLRLANVEMGLK
ncbi:hypothetical protein BC629DRAFT_1498949 [Irpex lacteus]|nr:hypothetical protein BC629DRAFT_1498949 [Irpex lacteus]